jgi:hypothetical protein
MVLMPTTAGILILIQQSGASPRVVQVIGAIVSPCQHLLKLLLLQEAILRQQSKGRIGSTDISKMV